MSMHLKLMQINATEVDAIQCKSTQSINFNAGRCESVRFNAFGVDANPFKSM